MIELAVLSVFAFAFAVRRFQRWNTPRVGSDQWEEFAAADAMRENNHKPPEHIPGFLLSSGFWGDPRLMTIFLSYLPKEWVEKLDSWFGAIVGGLFATLTFLVCFLVTGSANISFVAGVITGITPLVTGRTCCRITDRSLSWIFSTIGLLAAFIFFETGLGAYGFTSVFCLALVFLLNKFSAQFLIGISVFLSAYYWNPLFLGLAVAGWALAVGLTMGKHLTTTKNHVMHSMHYASGFNKLAYAYLLKSFWSYPVNASRKLKVLDFKGAAKELYHHPIVFLFIQNPFFLLLLALMAVRPSFTVFPVLRFFLAWVVGSFVLAVLTSFKFTRHFGAPERYMEYSVLPMSILFSILFFYPPTENLVFLLFVMAFSWSMLLALKTKRDLEKHIANIGNKESRELIQFLNTMKNKNFICLPYVLSYLIPYASQNNVLFPDTTWGHINQERVKQGKRPLWRVFQALEKYDPIAWEENIKEFNIDYVLAWKENNDYAAEFNLSRYNLVFENPKYAVYAI